MTVDYERLLPDGGHMVLKLSTDLIGHAVVSGVNRQDIHKILVDAVEKILILEPPNHIRE